MQGMISSAVVDWTESCQGFNTENIYLYNTYWLLFNDDILCSLKYACNLGYYDEYSY